MNIKFIVGVLTVGFSAALLALSAPAYAGDAYCQSGGDCGSVVKVAAPLHPHLSAEQVRPLCTPEPTSTPAPIVTPSPKPVVTPVPSTPKPTPVVTATPKPTVVPTATPKPTNVPTPTATAVPTPSATPSPTPDAVPTPSVTLSSASLAAPTPVPAVQDVSSTRELANTGADTNFLVALGGVLILMGCVATIFSSRRS